MVQSLKSR